MTRRQRVQRALTSRDSIVALGTLLLAMLVTAEPRAAVAGILLAGMLVFREPPGLARRVSRLHLDPGDKILVEVKGHVPVKRMNEMAVHLRRLFPRNDVVLVGRGVFVTRAIPADTRCTCDISERSLCIIHGADEIHIEEDRGAIAVADRIFGGQHDSILLCPEGIKRWPTQAHTDVDLVLAGEMVIKDRCGERRPASRTELDFAVAYGKPDRAVLIQRTT